MRRIPARGWVYLAATVVLEVVATLMLKASNGFTVVTPTIVSIVSYAVTVVVLALALKSIPMSVAYVIWTGAGTAGVAVFGALFLGDRLSGISWLGIALVIFGVVAINARRSPGTDATHATEAHAKRP